MSSLACWHDVGGQTSEAQLWDGILAMPTAHNGRIPIFSLSHGHSAYRGLGRNEIGLGGWRWGYFDPNFFINKLKGYVNVWHVPDITNSNGVSLKCDNCNGIDPINPKKRKSLWLPENEIKT